MALTVKFFEDIDKAKQWDAFLNRNKLIVGGASFTRVIEHLNAFLMPVVSAVAHGLNFDKTWAGSGPWMDKQE